VNSLSKLTGALTAASAIFLGSQAAAQPLTNYVHYLVAGDSAQGLFESMLSNGPRVGGGKAYASTRMDPDVSASTQVSGGRCRVAGFKMNMTFTIRLPQLEKQGNVEPALRQSFERFYNFAKRHEERHREIWLQCAAEAETLATGVTAPTCAEAEARSLKIVEDVSRRCDRRHAEFDAGEQKRLSTHPFMKQALFKIPALPPAVTVASTKHQQSDLHQGALASPQ
jgi:predicted secreted Zn-dependent protease